MRLACDNAGEAVRGVCLNEHKSLDQGSPKPTVTISMIILDQYQ